MEVVNKVSDLRALVAQAKREGNTVGFVPTMGFLHEGHLSLIKQAKKECDTVIVSIFVNPTQFGEGEDLDAYPRDIPRDLELTESANADIVFTPSVDEMYPSGYSTSVEVEGIITKVLCGASRPGHFKGVTTIVNKLFNMVQPDKAFFGQKDAQQVSVIQKMVRDLNMSVEVVPCPIVREADGLAMSSRNTYLSETERKDALVLSKSIYEAKEMIVKGNRDAEAIKTFIKEKINSVEYAEIDYVEVVSGITLENLVEIEGDVLIAVAVKVGKPRLIDNIRFTV